MSKYQIKGGFSFGNIIVEDDFMEWGQKQIALEQKQRDPVLKGYNNIKIRVNENLIPPCPVTLTDIEELQSFPFTQVNELKPNDSMTKLLQLGQKVEEYCQSASVSSGVLTKEEIEIFGKLCKLTPKETTDYIKFVGGEIKNI